MVNAILTYLATNPEVLHVLFAIGGAGIVWLYKYLTGSNLPPEIASLVESLLAQRKLAQAHATLQDLGSHAAAVVPTVAAAQQQTAQQLLLGQIQTILAGLIATPSPAPAPAPTLSPPPATPPATSH